MPTEMGSMRHGIEKKVPKDATANPAAITSVTNGTGVEGAPAGRAVPPAVRPNSRPEQIVNAENDPERRRADGRKMT
jgi:hypothetical protein